ncbi:cupin domain-containing protein [Natrialbaceae archaeon AArc-T1-2]|uniref:cupin domain-containing protein n=1 Tax=Natrialbaceae archaeon AArc-T1-2 TaxID=3053904 RepID=UPI00255B19E6|nr:cupin domain-containing protein [Natrialbaceae archaeon AArc-T1-2]WIV68718.1 cupin domain-containing protein [Natrialbaceae archaeon AArc-T1-2]
MERIAVDDVEIFMSAASECRPLSRALETTDVAINHYVVEPGEAFSAGFHTHDDQEEIFYIIRGEATFDTEEGTVTLGPDEAIRFSPGDFQHGYNEGDEPVQALALGAPRETETGYILCETCDDIGEIEMNMTETRDAIVVSCSNCGTAIDRFD